MVFAVDGETQIRPGFTELVDSGQCVRDDLFAAPHAKLIRSENATVIPPLVLGEMRCSMLTSGVEH